MNFIIYLFQTISNQIIIPSDMSNIWFQILAMKYLQEMLNLFIYLSQMVDPLSCEPMRYFMKPCAR